jgi:DNA repair protein RecO (recombination protein O)
MSEIKTEGIILKMIPYKDHHRIIQIFTPDSGIISLLAKGVSRPKMQALLSPLTQLEIVYRKKGSDLCFFKEGFVIEHHHFLRERWDLLESAGKIASALLQSQFPEKAAPDLYKLLIACLKHLPYFQQPATLIALFYLKLLTHEGVIAWERPALFPLSYPQQTWNELKNLAHAKSFRAHYAQIGLGDTALQLENLLKTLL